MKSLSLTPLIGQKTDSLTGVSDTGPFRVVIVDDDENDRRMMAQDLEKTGEFVCVGAYGSAKKALAEIPKVRPHVVLMDIRMPGMDSHECARRLKVIMVQLKIIVVTGLLNIDTMNKSLQAGADGYLTKPAGAAQFLAVLKLTVRSRAQCRADSNGLQAKDRSAAGALENNSLLTARETEIMALLARGFLDKEIADNLGISYSTVHFHLHNIFPKFAAGNRIEAVMRWRDANRS